MAKIKKLQILTNGLIFKTDRLYVDQHNIYIDSEKHAQLVPFASAISWSRTSSRLGNRYFWKRIFTRANAQKSVEFRANTTLWSRNFVQFYHYLREQNPQTVKIQYPWWRLL